MHTNKDYLYLGMVGLFNDEACLCVTTFLLPSEHAGAVVWVCDLSAHFCFQC